MTRKTRRLYLLLGGLAALALAAVLVLTAFRDNLVFFYSPSDVVEKSVPADRRFRLGGLVEPGSIEKDGIVTRFRVTDGAKVLPVSFKGMLPDLFREGQGVVADGRLNNEGQFVATEVLAKHDENYIPREVAEALKKTGNWHPDQAQPKQPGQGG